MRAPTWVGDVVMATPVLRALRRAHPEAQITFEAAPHIEGLVRGLETFDHFLPDSRRGLGAVVSRSWSLRAGRFDWAVLLPDSARSALAPFLARIPVRAGYARDLARRTLLTVALDPPVDDAGERVPVSMIERYLCVTRALGCPDAGGELDLVVDEGAREAVRARLAQAGIARDAGLLAVTPGANFGASKLWPTEHFASACDGIARAHGLRTVLAPGPGEEPTAREIADRMQEPALVLDDPVTGLAGLSALIADARLVLTNDTGPRHIAVAFGVPVVVLMGPTDPRHTEHWMERQRVLREAVDCSPCHLKTCPIDHRCMTRLAPARALAAAAELLA